MDPLETNRSSKPTSRVLNEMAHRMRAKAEGVPREAFLLGATASVAASFLLQVVGRKHQALFVGQWAPTLLLAGLYLKGVRDLPTSSAGGGESVH